MQLSGGRVKGVGRAPWRLALARSAARVRADISFAVIDSFLITLAYFAALMLRFLEFPGVPFQWWSAVLQALPVIIVVHLLANVALGAYGHVWEFASVAEAVRMVLASVAAALVLLIGVAIARLGLGVEGPVPISVIVIGSMLSLGGMGAVRFRSRLFSLRRRASEHRALVVGTGLQAAHLARYGPSTAYPLQVVGFVTTSSGKSHPKRLAGLPVVGGLHDLPELVERLGIDQVIMMGESGRVARELVDLCLETDVRLRIIPGLDSVLNGNGGLRDVRDLELSDLLPRPEVSTDLGQVAATLAGRRVLVTGAGGSIGSEIVRQILAFEPSQVIALDHDETHLHEAAVGWASDSGSAPIPVLCDVRDRQRLLRVFRDFRPEVVFHAAAHKHVPILEACPDEAVKTNVLGTAHVLEGARQAGVERFVLISTDKAVHPSSVMGASKRVAEMMVQSASSQSQHCVYSAVRFGNVLGSRGSVIPTFLRQIQHQGPVTVTDPEMTRYFMTVGEAVQLVLQTAALAEGGEVFVLDMGEPVRILDLAHRLIRVAGLVPGRDIEVVTIGRRPGEKLTEALSDSPLVASPHPRINIARATFPGAITLMDAVGALVDLSEEDDLAAVREMLLETARGEWDPEEVVHLEFAEELSFRN
jgi:FlaA1/EpsC-like NDP-sugar epimerase